MFLRPYIMFYQSVYSPGVLLQMTLSDMSADIPTYVPTFTRLAELKIHQILRVMLFYQTLHMYQICYNTRVSTFVFYKWLHTHNIRVLYFDSGLNMLYSVLNFQLDCH